MIRVGRAEQIDGTKDATPLKDTLLRILYSGLALFVTLVIVSWSENSLNMQVRQSDDVIWSVEQQGEEYHLMISGVVPEGVGEKAGLKVGDRVLAINSIPLISAPTISNAAQIVLNNAPTDRPIPYLIERDGRRMLLSITLVEVFPIVILVYPVFALLWVVIGLIVALARPRGRAQQLFFLTGLMSFFSFSNAPVRELPVAILWSGAGTLFLLFWITFTDTFPVRQNLVASWRRRLLLALPVTLTTATLLWILYSGSLARGEVSAEAFTAIRLIAVGIYVLYYFFGIALLFRGYRKMEGARNRRPMRIILIGTVVSTLSIIYAGFASQNANSLGVFSLQFLITSIPVVALPLSFGYAIFRYQLMDVRAVFRTALVYLITTGAIVGLYLLLAINLGRAVGDLIGLERSSTVELAILILFILMFDPVRRWIGNIVAERFFPEYRDYSQRVTEFSSAVSGTIGVDRVADLLTTTLRRHLMLDPVTLVILDPEEGTIEPGSREGTERSLSEGTIRRIAELTRNSGDLLPLATEQERELREAVDRGYRYAVGLHAGGRETGLLLLGGRADGRIVHGSQISFIRNIAAQAASAIEAERLYRGELERRAYMQELGTARRIQESLLPANPPTIPGIQLAAVSQPARTVGGDYYEVIRTGDGRLLTMVADVSGKGLPAALYMAELHGMVRIVAGIEDSPAAMLRLLNRRLVEVLERGTFITATIGIVDTRSGELRLARAGHTPIVRVRGGAVEEFTPRGLPLGLPAVDLFDSMIEEIAIPLETEDHILFYSDGVTEGMNDRRGEYGPDRLYRLIASLPDSGPEAWTEAILEDLAEHRGEAEQNDDISLLVIRREATRKPTPNTNELP